MTAKSPRAAAEEDGGSGARGAWTHLVDRCPAPVLLLMPVHRSCVPLLALSIPAGRSDTDPGCSILMLGTLLLAGLQQLLLAGRGLSHAIHLPASSKSERHPTTCCPFAPVSPTACSRYNLAFARCGKVPNNHHLCRNCSRHKWHMFGTNSISVETVCGDSETSILYKSNVVTAVPAVVYQPTLVWHFMVQMALPGEGTRHEGARHVLHLTFNRMTRWPLLGLQHPPRYDHTDHNPSVRDNSVRMGARCCVALL